MPLGAQPSAGTGFPCGLTRPRSEKSNTASAPRHWPGLPLRTDLGPDAQLSERLSAWGGLRGRGPGRRGWRQEEAAEPSTPSCAGAPAPAPLATAWHGQALCTRPPDRPLRRAAVQARVSPQCRSQALATRAGVTDRSAESKARPASPSPGPPAPAAGPSRAGAGPPAPPAAPAAAPGPRARPAPAPAAARPAPAARGRPPDPAPAPAAAPEAGPAPAPAAARGRGGVCIQVHVPHTPDPTGPCPGLPGRYASLPQAPLSLWGSFPPSLFPVQKQRRRGGGARGGAGDGVGGLRGEGPGGCAGGSGRGRPPGCRTCRTCWFRAPLSCASASIRPAILASESLCSTPSDFSLATSSSRSALLHSAWGGEGGQRSP